jgi:hypothetical protein
MIRRGGVGIRERQNKLGKRFKEIASNVPLLWLSEDGRRLSAV